MKRYLSVVPLAVILVGCCVGSVNQHDTIEQVEVQPQTCADIVELVNVNPSERELSEYYINQACEAVGATDVMLERSPKIQFIFGTTSHVIALCTPPPVKGVRQSLWLACTTPNMDGAGYLGIVQFGSPGQLKHEMLHVIFSEAGIPSEQHHPLMEAANLYWVGPEESGK